MRNLFEKYHKLLTNSGGDINIILQFAKIKQVNRYIGIKNDKIFLESDIKYAFEKLEKNRKTKEDFPYWLYT